MERLRVHLGGYIGEGKFTFIIPRQQKIDISRIKAVFVVEAHALKAGCCIRKIRALCLRGQLPVFVFFRRTIPDCCDYDQNQRQSYDQPKQRLHHLSVFFFFFIPVCDEAGLKTAAWKGPVRLNE